MGALCEAFGVDGLPLIVAEIGGNHGGRLALALEMVDAATASGAHAVKFQTYVTDRFVSRSHPSYEEFAREALSFDELAVVAQHCRARNIVFFSTPFDEDSADLLESLDVPAFKIASGDLTHLSLLRHVAAKGRPVLLATGASTGAEIDAAVAVVRQVSEAELVLLHCVSAYPAPDEEINLRVIPELARQYGVAVGFSDHTVGIEVALAAVALGAQVIEKHFTIDQSLAGGDNAMSVTPDEMAALVKGSRRIPAALGDGVRRLTASERRLLPALRRSLTLRRPLAAGEAVAREDLIAVRPGTGIDPGHLDAVVGRRASRDLPDGRLLEPADLV